MSEALLKAETAHLQPPTLGFSEIPLERFGTAPRTGWDAQGSCWVQGC